MNGFACDFLEILEAVIASPDVPLAELAPVRRIRARGERVAIG